LEKKDIGLSKIKSKMAYPKGSEEKFEANKFKKGQSGNPAGRPKKMINSVIASLREQGYEEATKDQVKSVYLHLINLDMPKIKRMVEDSEQPALIRVVGKAILSRQGFEIIEKMLDRSIGKPDQKVNQEIGLSEDLVQEVFKFGDQEFFFGKAKKE